MTAAGPEMAFDNPARRTTRIALAIACLCLVCAGLAWAAPGNQAADGTLAADVAVFVVAMGLVGGMIALIISLHALAAVGAVDRAGRAFRAGHALADWRFSPAEWDAFVATQKSWFTTGSRIARMRANPRVLIGDSAISVGGIITPWNVQMTVLKDIRTTAGPPMLLELTLGPRGVLQALYTVLGVINFLSFFAGESVTWMGDTKRTVSVPVPRRQTDEAAGIVAKLRSS